MYYTYYFFNAGPPTEPLNLKYCFNLSSVTISWVAPLDTPLCVHSLTSAGGRSQCSSCSSTYCADTTTGSDSNCSGGCGTAVCLYLQKRYVYLVIHGLSTLYQASLFHSLGRHVKKVTLDGDDEIEKDIVKYTVPTFSAANSGM